jgi:hypothetical protein
MEGKSKHEHFCFAGRPAPCKGYFPNDVLPCVCGAEGDVITALSQVAIAAPLEGTPAPASPSPWAPRAARVTAPASDSNTQQ